MRPDLRLVQGLPPGAIPAAARLYWQAFGPKLGRLLGPDARAHRFFMAAIQPEHCLAALDRNDDLLGLAGLPGPDGGFAGGRIADLSRIYGSFGARWRARVLDALPRDEDPRRFLIDGLCVDARCRGQGIGRALIAAAEILARDQGFAQIQIDVAAENLPARRLYESLGYRPAARLSTGALRWVFRISATCSMVKML